MKSSSPFLSVRRAARALSLLVLLCFSVLPAVPAGASEQALLAVYPRIKARLEKNQFAAPIYLESSETEGALRVDMYGIFSAPFATVRDGLQSPQNWCDIAPLHLNIKACTARSTRDQWFVTLYSGRKSYQPPADAYPLKLSFVLVSREQDYFQVALAADAGPLSTKDHRMMLEAAPLDQGRTLLHFTCSYRHGRVARMAIATYFATIARDKVGFTVIPRKDGKQVYVDGVRGAIERNAVRYYMAFESYMEALKYPEDQRFEQRISRWYDLTARYPRQLKEMEKQEYLTTKRREHSNQLVLQKSEGGQDTIRFSATAMRVAQESAGGKVLAAPSPIEEEVMADLEMGTVAATNLQ